MKKIICLKCLDNGILYSDGTSLLNIAEYKTIQNQNNEYSNRNIKKYSVQYCICDYGLKLKNKAKQ